MFTLKGKLSLRTLLLFERIKRQYKQGWIKNKWFEFIFCLLYVYFITNYVLRLYN